VLNSFTQKIRLPTNDSEYPNSHIVHRIKRFYQFVVGFNSNAMLQTFLIKTERCEKKDVGKNQNFHETFPHF
jgi:hypothetical protein